MFYLLRRAIAAIRKCIDDDGRASGAVSFVNDLLERGRIGRGAFCDRALDGVFRHVRLFRGLDDGAEIRRVHIAIRFLTLDGDAPSELAPKIAFRRVRRAFLAFNLCPLVVSGHRPLVCRAQE